MENNKVTVLIELNPVMEVIGLIFLLANKDSYKDFWIKEANELGIKGEAFFQKHSAYMDKYLAEFEKYYNPVEKVEQFITVRDSEMDIFYRMLFYSLVTQPEWVEDLDRIPEEVVLERIIKMLSNRSNSDENEVTLYQLRTTDKFIQFLDRCEFNHQEKWALLQLYSQPKVILAKFINLVKANIPAYEKAVAVVDTELNKMLEVYIDSTTNKKLSAYKSFVEGMNEPITVIPCLVFPESLAMLKNKLFYGLLLDVIPLSDNNPEDTREFLQMRLKALADPSKLQIIQLLKHEGEKYNLEIAEHLGITAATASHHMSGLMATGLVGINKQQGKVYYHVEREVIGEFLSKLERYLL